MNAQVRSYLLLLVGVVGLVVGAGAWQRHAERIEQDRIEAARQVRASADARRRAGWKPAPRTGLEWATVWIQDGGKTGEGKRAMTARVVVGDERVVAGQRARVIEVVRTTDADGVVAFATEGFKLSVQQAPGVPLASVEDESFSAFVLQGLEDPNRNGEFVTVPLYAVGVQHPALGEKIAPAPMSAAPMAQTITMGWKCPDISIKHNGVLQEGQYVTFVVKRQTIEDGMVTHLYGADRFADVGAGAEGEWQTDINGVVRQNLGDGGGLAQIYFPNGAGALFQRPNDRRDERADPPTEFAAEVWCYHRGVRVRVSEGNDVEIDLGGLAIQVHGEPGAWACAWLWDVQGVGEELPIQAELRLDGAGNGSMTGLMPGRYVMMQRKGGELDWNSMSPRQWVNVQPDGKALEVTLAALASPSPGNVLIYAYDYGAEPVSVDLYNAEDPCDLRASGSQIDINLGVAAVLKTGNTGFYLDGVPGQHLCYEVTLRASVLYLGTDQVPGMPSNVWWRGSDAHRDMPCVGGETGYVLRETDGRQPDADFMVIPGGIRSGPVYEWPEPWTEGEGMGMHWVWGEPYAWEIIYPDESTKSVGLKLGIASGLSDGVAYETEDLQICSNVYADLLQGGKISANCVLGHDTRIGTGANPLPEAARMGLEWGEWWPQTEVRLVEGGVGSFLGNVCPYCLGPVWRWPSTGAHVYGYCGQCGSDARTYVRTPTVGAGEYQVRVVRYRPERRSALLLTRWLRPVDYIENDDYIETYEGLTRWVTRHAVLGTWANGFVDGDDAADIAARHGIEADLFVQPKALPNPYVRRPGTFDVTCTMADDSSRTFRVTVRPGSYPTAIRPFRKTAAAEGGEPARFGFIKDVTNIQFVEGEGGPLCPWQLVADVPALVMAETPIADQADTPWAGQFVMRFGEPHATVDGFGRIWVAFADEGKIRVVVRSSPQRAWEERTPAFDEGDQEYKSPCVMCMSTGRVHVSATLVGGKSIMRMSCDDGESWGAPG